MPTIKLKRGAEAGLPTLAEGEPGFTTDTYKLFIGDGATNHEIGGGSSYTDEQAQDAVGSILVDSAQLDFTYNDVTPSITATIMNGVVTEAMQWISDNTTCNVSTSAHGYAPKAPNDSTKFLNGLGAWAVPPDTTADSFKTIAVSGQSDVVADSATDTLTLVAGTNVTITTNAGTDTITLAASSGSRLSTLTPDAKSALFTAVWGTYYTCTAGAYTITLPTAVGNTGKIIVISCNCASTVKLTLDGNGAETVGGKATLDLVIGDRIELISNGTNVEILSFTHGDWVGYTANITGSTTNPTLGGTRTELYTWKRQGQDILLNFMYRHGSAGSGGSGQWLIDLPLSSSVDTAVIATGNWNGSVTAASRNVIAHGTVIWYNGTTYVANASIFAADSTHIGMWLDYDGGGTAGSLWNSTTWPFTATELLITFQARIPISGW